MKKGKDGLYRTSFRFDGKTFGVSGRSESEVNRKIGQKKAELKAGQAISRKPVTVAKYGKEWAETYHGTDSETDKDYRRIVAHHIAPDIGHLLLRDVTESTLQALLNRKAEDLSPSRVHKIKITLGQMFRKARKNHLIADNPAEDLTLPDGMTAGTRRSLTEDERQLLLHVLPGQRGNLYCKLMLYCGLRPGEVNALQWKHVDLENGIIHVMQAVKHNTTTIGPPKSAAGYRDIPIPKAFLRELNGGTDEDYVASWTGKMITRSGQARMWASVKRAMDIEAGATVYRNQIVESVLADDLDLYCLRHTYCTDLQKAGVPINIARELMGHSDISVTASIYTHTSTDEAIRAVGKLDEQIAANSAGPVDNVVYVRFGA